MADEPAIAFTGGGTGGHVFPALAVIEELSDRGYHRFLWLGSPKGVERRIVEEAGIPYVPVPSGKLRRYISVSNVTDLFRVASGFLAGRSALGHHRPGLLFSKGGFVSVPPVAAAASLGIPVISHESDFDPGLATRINARFSRRVITAYPETAARFGEKAVALGNPIRKAVREGNRERASERVPVDLTRALLVVAGGSLGAVQLNEIVAAELDRLTETFSVVHQRGEHPEVAPNGEHYYSRPFFGEEWGDILARADLLLCRGGAGTLWEAGASKTPAVVVPLSARASRGDQIRNARYFEERGAAVAIAQDPPEPGEVVDALFSLFYSADRYDEAVRGMAQIVGADVTGAIADEIESLLTMEGRQ
ncbi:MAG: UDP-N-acetylglucosamine--N-acetylmuramyl-(pentapeptide) pyrophosphoryl-undecaprenol N-acetylglucosamine transferase [Spirochaetaceae bacterium]